MILNDDHRSRSARARPWKSSSRPLLGFCCARGGAALNTNYIAERAAISVGTLYEYFPNRVAILVAMARREIVRVTASVTRAISDPSNDQRADAARLAVRALIA